MKLKNNATSIIQTDINTDSNTFLCKIGEGELFPTENFEIFLEYFEGKVVIKRESIFISSRSGDVFNIQTRGFSECVQNDSLDIKIRSKNILEFPSGSQISQYISEKNIDDINEKITNLENSKLDKTDSSITKAGNTFNTSGKLLKLDGNGKVPVSNLPVIGGGVISGSITIYAGDNEPDGYLLCDGRTVSRSTYSRLFSVIGTKYGNGNGSSTFNLPNIKGRVVVGHDEGQSEFNQLGKTGGEKTHVLTINEMPSHGHNFSYKTGRGGGSGKDITRQMAGYDEYTKEVNNTGGGQAHNNLQPYIVLNYIIKT